MRALLVLATLGWLLSLPWMAVVGYFVLIAAATVILWFLSVSIERRTISLWSESRAIDPNYVAALETMIAEAEAKVEILRDEIEGLRSAAASEPDPRAALYHKVGLVPGAPRWLIMAARKAYRSALHPDRHPAHRKKEAERRFLLAENVFEAISSQRASA